MWQGGGEGEEEQPRVQRSKYPKRLQPPAAAESIRKRGRASPSVTERLAAAPPIHREKKEQEQRRGRGELWMRACVRGGVGGRRVGVCRWVGADPFAVTCLKGMEGKEEFFSATEPAWEAAVRGERCYWCCPWC